MLWLVTKTWTFTFVLCKSKSRFIGGREDGRRFEDWSPIRTHLAGWFTSYPTSMIWNECGNVPLRIDLYRNRAQRPSRSFCPIFACRWEASPTALVFLLLPPWDWFPNRFLLLTPGALKKKVSMNRQSTLDWLWLSMNWKRVLLRWQIHRDYMTLIGAENKEPPSIRLRKSIRGIIEGWRKRYKAD